MHTSDVRTAIRAALASASASGLPADDAVVLQDSDKLTLRLLPCDVVARVALAGQEMAQFEIDLVQRLAAVGCPVVALDPRVAPRVHTGDDFAVTFWTHHEALPAPEVAPAAYADALVRLHAGMRHIDMETPHFTDRIAQAVSLISDRTRTPDLSEADRLFLSATLTNMRRAIQNHHAPEQILHGEPHPGNVLNTEAGLLFIDFETCCRGPVEFDIAHAPAEVGQHYPGVDQPLLRQCRALVLAMITAWRWNREDRLPNGRRLAREWLSELRGLLDSDAP